MKSQFSLRSTFFLRDERLPCARTNSLQVGYPESDSSIHPNFAGHRKCGLPTWSLDCIYGSCHFRWPDFQPSNQSSCVDAPRTNRVELCSDVGASLVAV